MGTYLYMLIGWFSIFNRLVFQLLIGWSSIINRLVFNGSSCRPRVLGPVPAVFGFLSSMFSRLPLVFSILCCWCPLACPTLLQGSFLTLFRALHNAAFRTKLFFRGICLSGLHAFHYCTKIILFLRKQNSFYEKLPFLLKKIKQPRRTA